MLRRTFWIAGMLAVLLAAAGCGFSGPDTTEARAPTPDPRLPYPIPGVCPQTNGIAEAGLPAAHRAISTFWIGSENIMAGLSGSIAWQQGDNQVTWYSPGGQPAITSSMGESTKARFATIKFLDAKPPYYPSIITIPLSGCWSFIADAAPHKLIFTVFAYPDKVVR